MKKFKTIIASLVIFITLGVVFINNNVYAIDPCAGVSTGPLCSGSTKTVPQIIQIVCDTLFFLIGAASIIVIIIAGIRYVISGGESSAVANAKNSILYAVIGVVVAVAGYGILHFVLAQLA